MFQAESRLVQRIIRCIPADSSLVGGAEEGFETEESLHMNPLYLIHSSALVESLYRVLL